MASRIDYSQNRKLYVGTTAEVTVADGNAIIAGNVGIGTTSPGYKLEVVGNARVSSNFYIGNVDAVTTATEVLVRQSSRVRGITPANLINASGGPYLPLSAGSSYPLTDTLYIKPSGSPTNTMLISARANDTYGNIQFTNAAETANWTELKSTSTQFTINNVNVGIGTTSPSVKLDIAGTDSNYIAKFTHSTVSGYAPGSILLEAGQSTSRGQGIYHYNNVADENWFTGVPYSVSSKKWIVANLYQQYQDVTTAQLQYALLTIDSDTGNVGIGTTSPDFKLDVAGDVRIEGDSGLYFGDTSTSPKWGIASTGLDLLINNSTTDGDVVFLNDGGVGIGVSSPGAKLDVNGRIISRNDVFISSVFPRIWLNDTNNNSDYSIINSNGTLRIYDDTNSTDRFVILPAGNVGIGTTNPNKKLTIQTSDSSWGSMRIYRDSATLGETGIGFFGTSTQATNQAWVIGEGGWGNVGDFVIGNENGGAGGNVRLLVQRNGNVGIGTTLPKAKLDVNSVFCVDSKEHTITNAFTTCLTVNLTSHTGCHVVITAFGDWGSHSSAAYRGEFFLQNGANIYNEPGIILRQDDNTSDGTDQIICQIVDNPSTANPKDFQIQIRHTDTTSPASFDAQLTYTVQGKFNSIT